MANEFVYSKETREPSLSAVELKDYVGKKLEVSDGRGNVVERVDSRDIASEKKRKLEEFKKLGFEEAASTLPITDQLNIILSFIAGTISRAEVVAKIKAVSDSKTKYAEKKALVLAAKTLDELEKVTW